jgi:riboflavin kinase/FMN adenylyltransferase
MKRYYNLDLIDSSIINSSVVTIGMFDGVHVGHLQVINTCCSIAKSQNLKSVLITFSNHPSAHFFPERQVLVLSSLEEKISLLNQTDLDIVIILPFDKRMAEYTAGTFVEKILLNKLKSKVIVFGYDNHFGKNREGSPNFIKTNFNNKLKTYIVNEKHINSEVVSSSKIKELLGDGDILLANDFLGYNYSVDSRVVHGKALGRTIGFPTANYDLTYLNKILPANGVYLTLSSIETPHGIITKYGLTNVGIKPTISSIPVQSIETYLFDFESEIYGCKISTKFINRLRSEKKFNSIEELKNQIVLDKNIANQMLTQIHVAS